MPYLLVISMKLIARKGFHAVTWSIWYNFTYLAVEAAITVVVINMPPVKSIFERIKNEN